MQPFETSGLLRERAFRPFAPFSCILPHVYPPNSRGQASLTGTSCSGEELFQAEQLRGLVAPAYRADPTMSSPQSCAKPATRASVVSHGWWWTDAEGHHSSDDDVDEEDEDGELARVELGVNLADAFQVQTQDNPSTSSTTSDVGGESLHRQLQARQELSTCAGQQRHFVPLSDVKPHSKVSARQAMAMPEHEADLDESSAWDDGASGVGTRLRAPMIAFLYAFDRLQLVYSRVCVVGAASYGVNLLLSRLIILISIS